MGVLLGAGSMLVGYLFSKLASSQENEVDYLKNVPRYRNLGELQTDLEKLPAQRADVLVEGIVRKHASSLSCETAGLDGAAKLVTTTDYTKVWDPKTGGWSEHTSSTENSRISVPFRLADQKGRSVIVESVHQAGGFRSLLQQVYQHRTKPEQRTIGDFATNVTVSEIPNGTLRRELLLVFGTSFAGYGQAMLVQQADFKPDVVFFPSEVSTTIRALISHREMIASGLKFLSLVLIAGGGVLVLFAALPLLRRMLQQETRRRQIEQPQN